MKIILAIKNFFKVDEKDKLNKIEKIILIVFLILTLFWAFNIDMKHCPDEDMRYLLPKYIYNHAKLPHFTESEVIHPELKLTYAFYPFWLGPIIGAFFMKIVSFFSTKELILLFAARLTNVLSGTLYAYFIIKIAKRLFKDLTKYFSIIIGIFIPQLVFLSSYFNYDIISVLGTAIITLSWIRFIQDGASVKSSIIMAIGIIICSLSYYFSYGHILMSIFFILYYFYEERNQKI